MNCTNCNKPLDQDRIEALKFLGKPLEQAFCVECAAQTDTKIKAIYPSFSGDGMIFVDKVGDFHERPEWQKLPNEVNVTVNDTFEETDEELN